MTDLPASGRTASFLMPLLAVPATASYKWGYPALHFHLTAVGRLAFAKALAALIDLRANWTRDDEFTALVALLHEAVHYQQDMTTGVGHWDYVKRESVLDPLLACARDASRSDDPARKGRAMLAAQQLYEPMALTTVVTEPPGPRQRRLHEALAAANNGKAIADISPFTVPFLLEAEAVATVYIQLARMPASDEQNRIAQRHNTLFLPSAMPEAYRDTIFLYLGAMLDHLKIDAREMLKNLPAYLRFLLFFIDVALAYPPPRVLDTLPEKERRSYEPGVRLIALFHAFAALDDRGTSRFLEPAGAMQWNAAEEVLLARSRYPYLPSARIYEEWRKTFDDRARGTSRPLDELRRQAARTRTTTTPLKTLGAVWESGLLPPFDTEAGRVFNVTGGDFADPARWQRLLDQASLHVVVEQLVDHYCLGNPVSCPFASTCDVALPECATGLANLGLLPRAPACRVRGLMTQHGFPPEA